MRFVEFGRRAVKAKRYKSLTILNYSRFNLRLLVLLFGSFSTLSVSKIRPSNHIYTNFSLMMLNIFSAHIESTSVSFAVAVRLSQVDAVLFCCCYLSDKVRYGKNVKSCKILSFSRY